MNFQFIGNETITVAVFDHFEGRLSVTAIQSYSKIFRLFVVRFCIIATVEREREGGAIGCLFLSMLQSSRIMKT